MYIYLLMAWIKCESGEWSEAITLYLTHMGASTWFKCENTLLFIIIFLIINVYFLEKNIIAVYT